MTITQDIHIDCPPTMAFDLIADVRNEKQWNDGVSRAEMTTEEPVGPGSQFITVRGTSMGDTASTITTFDRPERLEFSATSKRMDLAISFTFAETDSGTMVHATFVPKPKGAMAVLFPLLRPIIGRGMAKQHQNLKAFCESQAQSPDA
jgi:Polyketide cyclase / dehydrase and lipid transport